MTLSELKPITFFLFSIVLFCCSSYVLGDTTIVKDFSVYFIFISVSGLAISVFLCQISPVKISTVSCTNCNAKINFELYRLYELFEACINDDLRLVMQDLTQIENLVNHAGNSLTDSYQHIISVIDQQQQVVDSLVETLGDDINSDKISQIKQAKLEVYERSSQCIRSLQFEDIVSQIVRNCLSNADEISRYLSQFKSVIKNQQKNPSLHVDAISQLKILIGNIKEFQLSRGYQTRIEFAQKDLTAGHLELF